jgi:tetratricopeptide (TPR) repeat protein
VFGLQPEQSPVPMLRIKKWNPRWQREYAFSEPVELPANTELRIQFVYNNTSENEYQPSDPPSILTWGANDENEYPGVWFKIAPVESTHLTSLRQAFAQIELDSLKAAYRFALPSSPYDFRINARLGHILVGENKHDEALPFLRTALRAQSQSWNVHYNIGLTSIARNAFSEAANDFKKTLELLPDYAPARKALASAFAMQGNLKDAAPIFEQYLSQKPLDYEVQNNFGVILVRLNQFERAEAAYRASLKAGGPRSGAHANLAKLLIETEHHAEAERFILTSIPLTPERTAQRLRIQIAQLYARTGRHKLALEILTEALKVDPTFETARIGIGALNKAIEDLE